MPKSISFLSLMPPVHCSRTEQHNELATLVSQRLILLPPQPLWWTCDGVPPRRQRHVPTAPSSRSVCVCGSLCVLAPMLFLRVSPKPCLELFFVAVYTYLVTSRVLLRELRFRWKRRFASITEKQCQSGISRSPTSWATTYSGILDKSLCAGVFSFRVLALIFSA